MNSPLLTVAALATPILGLVATPARAGFDPAVVPAEAQWVLYLDINSLRSSALGTELMTLVPEIDLDSEQLPVKLNVPKLIESLGSATAYGTSFTEKPEHMDGALVVRGTDDLRKVVQGFLLAGSASEGSSGEMKIKELSDLGYEAYEVQNELLVALPPGDAILVSKSRESLAAARQLMGSDKGSLARAGNAALAPLIPKSMQSFLLAATVVPRDGAMMPESGPQARILQMASAASLAVGEDGGMTTARIQIDATSADMADKLVKILQGMVAMLSFAETDDEALATFLRSVTVEKTKSGALLNLAYPTDRLVLMLKTLRDEQKSSHQAADRGPAKPAPVEGRIVAEWVADKDLASDGPVAENILTHVVENVALRTGDMVWLNGNRGQGENGRFDYIDITPVDRSAPPVRFEAENMRLTHYRPESAEFASGGELIILTEGSGSARFAFPGAGGSYTLTVAYVDENDGRSAFSLSITDKQPQPGPEAPTP